MQESPGLNPDWFGERKVIFKWKAKHFIEN